MKITSENANELMQQIPITGDIHSQAKAWKVVYKFCLEQGMDYRSADELSGLQKVIKFITDLKQNQLIK